MANSLAIEGLHAGYGEVRVLSGVSINVPGGETVVLLGTNGNGKSTLIKCIMGQVRPTAGRIEATIDGTTYDLVGKGTEDIVGIGISLVPEGRRLFPKLTVEERSPARRLPRIRARAHRRQPGVLLRCVSAAKRAAAAVGWQHERRRAADAGDRARL